MRRMKGFTLIELLVVISIIALLLSILAPALSVVKDQARTVVCMTHQKDLTLAWNTYAVANNGLICGSYNYYGDRNNTKYADKPEFTDQASWVWAAWNGRENAPVITNPYGDSSSFPDVSMEEKIEGVKRGALWPYSDDIDVYRCPSDKNSFSHIRSYVIADNLNGQRPNVDGTANWKIFKRVENVSRPSESYIFMEESDPRPYNMDSFLFNAKNGMWRDPLAVWHRGSSSFSFADGHVEQRHWSQETVDHFKVADEYGSYFDWAWAPQGSSGFDDIFWMEAGWAR